MGRGSGKKSDVRGVSSVAERTVGNPETLSQYKKVNIQKLNEIDDYLQSVSPITFNHFPGTFQKVEDALFKNAVSAINVENAKGIGGKLVTRVKEALKNPTSVKTITQSLLKGRFPVGSGASTTYVNIPGVDKRAVNSLTEKYKELARNYNQKSTQEKEIGRAQLKSDLLDAFKRTVDYSKATRGVALENAKQRNQKIIGTFNNVRSMKRKALADRNLAWLPSTRGKVMLQYKKDRNKAIAETAREIFANSRATNRRLREANRAYVNENL